VDSGRFKGSDLVLHEGNQGRNNHGDSFENQGWQLIAEGFSASGWHYGQGIAALEYICNDVFLQWPEGIVSENGF
jgi:hypothetical protein